MNFFRKFQFIFYTYKKIMSIKLNISVSRLPDRVNKAIPVIVIIILWAFLAWKWLVGDVVIPYDSKTYHLPQTVIALNAIMQGFLPLWNLFSFCGIPFISDPQVLVFSPLYMLLMASGDYFSSNWIDIVQLLHVLVAGIGGYLYCCNRGIPRVAAVISSLVIMFGGAMSSRMQHTGIVVAFAYFPWALLATDHMLDRRQFRWVLTTALFVCLLAIHFSQVAFLCCILVAVYVVTDGVVSRDRGSFFGKIKRSSLAAMIALLLLAVPATLVLHNLSLSARQDMTFEMISNYIHLPTLLTLVAPDALGTLTQGNYLGVGDITEQYLYFGIVSAGLLLNAMIFAMRQKDRRIIFWSSVIVVMLVYAVGKETPVFKIFYDVVPGVSLFRRPTDAVFIIGFAFAMVIGFFLKKKQSYCAVVNNSVFFVTSLIVPALLVISVSIYGYGGSNSILTTYFRSHTIYYLSLFYLITVVIPILARYYPVFFVSKCFSVVLLVCVVADFAIHNVDKPMNASDFPGFSLLARGERGEIPVFDWLRSATAPLANNNMPVRVELVGMPQNWVNTPAALGIETTTGYNPLLLNRYLRIVGNETAHSINKWSPSMPGYDSPMFNLLGGRFILQKKGTVLLDKYRFPLRYASNVDGLIIEIRENIRALPRFFAVNKIIYEPDADFAIDNGVYFDTDYSKIAVVENKMLNNGIMKIRKVTTLCDGSPGTIELISYSSNRIVVDSYSQCRRVLIINNVWHPSWRSFVNGVETEVLRTNFLFQGVFLGSGKKHVEIEFSPLSL